MNNKRYAVRYRVKTSGTEGVWRFATARERTAFLVGYGPYVDVLDTWEEPPVREEP